MILSNLLLESCINCRLALVLLYQPRVTCATSSAESQEHLSSSPISFEDSYRARHNDILANQFANNGWCQSSLSQQRFLCAMAMSTNSLKSSKLMPLHSGRPSLESPSLSGVAMPAVASGLLGQGALSVAITQSERRTTAELLGLTIAPGLEPEVLVRVWSQGGVWNKLTRMPVE